MKELDLSSLYKVVKEKILIILLAAVVLAAAVFCYNSFFVSPTYCATTTILVNNGGLADIGNQGGNVDSNDITSSLNLVKTCIGVLESQKMHKELASALDDKYSYESLMSCFAFSARGEDSMIVDVYTYGKDKEEIKEIANTFLEIAPTFITYNVSGGVDVKVLAEADTAVKVAPRVAFNTAIAFVIGLLASALVFIVISLFKNTIESEQAFKARYDIPLLGTVPIFENKQTKGRLK